MSALASQELTRATAPYPGLRPFRDDEAEIFFGREEQTDQLLEKLQHSHFIAVVGPSGCGKSSLVRAGLIAALETGFLTDAGTTWRIAEMRPGDRPLTRLAYALLAPPALGPERGTDDSETAIVHAMLRRGPLGLIEILRETRLPPNTNLLLLVDQFEEIFRFREQGNADEADAFVALLLASSAQREMPVYVVITMRSDFLGDCALFAGLPEAINDGQYLTPRLSRDQIRAAITGPARVFGGDVEPALVNRLLNEVGPDPDQLPLLQHALMRMWARVKERDAHAGSAGPNGEALPSAVVTMADYEAVGALSEALSSHADQVFNGLTKRQQHIAEVMFRRLTERGVGKRDTRRPARLDDIAAVAGASTGEVIEVVEQLRQQDRNFLTPPPPVPITAATVLDIGHESLIRQWHRLYDWVEEEAASAAMYRRLLQTAHLRAAGKAELWSGADLEQARKWKAEQGPSKAWALRYGTDEEFELAMRFVRASEDQWAQTQRKAEQERERALRAQARKVKLITSAAAVLFLFVILTSVMAFWALRSREQAVAANAAALRSRDEALAARRRADSLLAVADSLSAYFKNWKQQLTRANNSLAAVARQATPALAESGTLRRAENARYAVGVYGYGVSPERFDALRQRLESDGYLISQGGLLDRRMTWLSPRARVLFYSDSAKPKADSLAASLGRFTGTPFDVSRGKGLGVVPGQERWTFFVHYVGK
jgi:energy-coupling factor transporter ATP-binding protein EcfA2